MLEYNLILYRRGYGFPKVEGAIIAAVCLPIKCVAIFIIS